MIDICHQLNVYGEQVGTLLAAIFTMVAFSRIAKKHREETAYIALAGMSLLCLVNIILAEPLHNVISLVQGSEALHILWSSAVAAVIITVLLMIVGKTIKAKAMPPKTLVICFFIGIALSNFVGMFINSSCTPPAKNAKHHG